MKIEIKICDGQFVCLHAKMSNLMFRFAEAFGRRAKRATAEISTLFSSGSLWENIATGLPQGFDTPEFRTSYFK